MAEYSEVFADQMRAAVGDTPYREVARRANISAAYVSDLIRGRLPKRSVVEAVADACRLDLDDKNRLLAAAGYAAVPAGRADSEVWTAEFKAEFAGRPAVIIADQLGLSTHEVVSLLNGEPPTWKQVRHIAREMGDDFEAQLRKSGLEEVPPLEPDLAESPLDAQVEKAAQRAAEEAVRMMRTAVPSPHQRVVQGLKALASEYGNSITVNWEEVARDNMTLEDAETILAEHRASAEKMRKKGVI